jgi:hypothetical protein
MSDIRPEKSKDKEKAKSAAKREEHVLCFICRNFVPLMETIELDHNSGRFKVRVCHKHLEV